MVRNRDSYQAVEEGETSNRAAFVFYFGLKRTAQGWILNWIILPPAKRHGTVGSGRNQRDLNLFHKLAFYRFRLFGQFSPMLFMHVDKYLLSNKLVIMHTVKLLLRNDLDLLSNM
jgi:hypothetical protein